jgi:hypothetical protein
MVDSEQTTSGRRDYVTPTSSISSLLALPRLSTGPASADPPRPAPTHTVKREHWFFPIPSNTVPPSRPPLPARCRVDATRLFARVWRCSSLPTPLPPPNPLPPPIPRYAVACPTLLPMPRRPCHPVRQYRRPPPISLLPSCSNFSTPYPPAKPWKKNSFVQQTAYSPLPRLQHPQRGSSFVCPTPGLSHSVLCFPPKIFPGHIFLPKLRYLLCSQFHPKVLRPDGVQ